MKTYRALLFWCASFALASPALLGGVDTKVKVPQDFPTIQAAVDAAAPGTTIVIAKGTYPENVVLTAKFGLTLQAKGKVTIDAGGAALPALSVQSSAFVTFIGLRLRNSDVSAINVGVCSDVRFRDCSVLGGGGGGIFIAIGAARIEVTDCLIKDVDSDGILSGANDLLVRGTRVLNVGVRGIVASGSRLDIHDCEVIGAGNDGITISTFKTNASFAVVAGCRVEGAGSDAVQVDQGASDVTVIANQLVAPGQHGVQVIAPAFDVSVLSNGIVKPAAAGLHSDADATTFDGNSTKKAGTHGIHLESGSQANLVTGNVFKKSAVNAVRVVSGTNSFLGNLEKQTQGAPVSDSSGGGNVYVGNNFAPVLL